MAELDLDAVRAALTRGDLDTAFGSLDRALNEYARTGDVEGVGAVVGFVEQVIPTLRSRPASARGKRLASAARRHLPPGYAIPMLAPTAPTIDLDQTAMEPRRPKQSAVEVLPASPLDRLPRKTRATVEQSLMPGETVFMSIIGSGSSAIVGTDRRAFIAKKGFTSGATFGQKLASFDYDNIVGIEVHGGALTGAVVIHVPGAGSVSTSYWQNGKSDPFKAYNAIPIMRPYEPAHSGAAALRALISDHQARGRPQSSLNQAAPEPSRESLTATDPLESLRKLGELRDAGVITEQEFESKKAELLDRL